MKVDVRLIRLLKLQVHPAYETSTRQNGLQEWPRGPISRATDKNASCEVLQVAEQESREP
jgi:hypothetical protein